MGADYSETFEALRDVYLEDSWVLALRQNDGQLTFDLDAVLTQSHPEYEGPKPGQQYDYRRAELVVIGDDLLLELSGAALATDATGQTDMGNIDSWQTDAEGWSLLVGEWGSARVRSARVQLALLSRE